MWLTSDLHFWHKNIIKYCTRPYKSVEKMNRCLIDKWNAKVDKEDHIFVLGDFSLERNPEKLKSIVNKLNGVKHLVLGNHDELKPDQYLKIGFTSVHTSLWLPYKDKMIYLAHDPAVKTALKKEDILFHGHVHKLWKVQPENNLINVGVDVWDGYPVLLENALALLQE